MAGKKVKNADLLNSIQKGASAEYQARIPKAVSETGIEVYNTLNDYPTLKNEFIDTLTNKVIKTRFYSKAFDNKLKMFHKGEIPFGSSMEQLFVEMAEKKGFREHFDGSTTVESDLIGVQKPKIHTKYITKNFEYKYKVTISEEQLRTAFMNSTGLGELVSQILMSLTNGCYYDEFNDVKALINNVCAGKKLVIDETTGLTKAVDLTSAEVKQGIHVEHVGNMSENPKLLSEKVRALTGRLSFASDKYNMAKVKQWSNASDMVLLTTPEILATLDVNVLADAFNVSKAELNIRTVMVDELPKQFKSDISGSAESQECYGLLIDKDFLQIYDTIMTMRKFDNGANLTVNHFLHKQGMLANCYFVNAIALVK